MLPIEPSWKTYYDAKKLLRQTEQRLKETRDYYPHVHLNSHHDINDLSNVSSSASSIHAGSRSIYPDDRLTNSKHQLLDSEALQTIRRKINKQKLAAERRAEQLFHSQSDAGHMFETYRSHGNYATSASLQNLHYSPHRQQQRLSPQKSTMIYTSQLSQSQSFPAELDNVLRHSTSTTKVLTSRENELERPATKRSSKVLPKDNYSLPNGRSTQQRSASASSKYQDLPSSPYLSPTNAQRLKHIRRVESAHVTTNSNFDSWRAEPIVTKKSTDDKFPKKKPSTEILSKLVKTKRDTSASKSSSVVKPKSDDEKKKLQDYIQQKREELFSKDDLDRTRRERLKKLHESAVKRSAITPKDLTEQTKQRLARLLGPSNNYSLDQSDSSLSSSSSSNDSIGDLQPSKSHEQLTIRSRSEPPDAVINNLQRHENLLRWAINLTRDCDVVENRFKYFRPDSTQPFETISSSSSLQRDDGNLRYVEHPKNGRLNSSSYRDFLVERRIYRDRAAAKIQAAYRGYSVRKLLNEKQKHLNDEFNKRTIHHRDITNTHSIDNTLLRNSQQSEVNLLPPTTPVHQKQLPIHSSSSSSTSTTPIPSPEPHVPLQIERRRSISPPLPPQMSPDNGRPIQFLPQTNGQHSKSTSKVDSLIQQTIRKSPVQQQHSTSSSSTTTSTTLSTRKRRSPSPQTTQLHTRHRNPQTSSPPTSSSESILTAREKRVRQKFNSDIELQAYEKRLKDIEKKIRQLVKRAFEIFDEKRTNSPTIGRTIKADESTISDDQKDSEPNKKKDSDTSSISTQQRHSDVVTSDASDLERRVSAYREQLKAKKAELERLKQRKNKEILRRQEDELKKQIESYDHEIQTLRLQPVQQEQTVPVPSSKLVEPSIQQDLIEEKESELRPVETPRDERDTQDDALSIVTDLHIESEIDEQHQPQIPIVEQQDLSSSESSEKSVQTPSPRVSKSPSSESVQVRTPSPTVEHQIAKFSAVDEPPKVVISTDYDEDFSQESATPDQPPVRDIEIEIESIHEDIESKPSRRSSSSQSSADEQSEILVLVKKSAPNTPRQSEDDKSSSIVAPIKLESDDEHTERDNQINQLTETFIRTFIDEAIDQGKEIEHQKIKSSVTKEASEWMSDEDLSDDENVKQIPITHEEDVENAIEKLSTQPEFLEQLDTTTNGTNDHDELKLDLSPLEEKTLDEPRIESPRKITNEEIIQPIVSHNREQVTQLCQQALTILYEQNTDFSNRTTINRTIPSTYFDNNQTSDNPEHQRHRQAYCRMIFDLCVELLHEMYSPSVRVSKYPEWQKSKLLSKRFYRSIKPKTRYEAEQFLIPKVLEILHLTSKQIIYSKWRMPLYRQYESEQFECVLDEELRRTETQWIDYEEDSIRIKFDVAEYIFDQLVQETLKECIHVANKRLLLSSNSTTL